MTSDAPAPAPPPPAASPYEPGLVSVVIPCYQQAHFLAEAVESCLAQTYRPLEVIVVDDGSPDDTAGVAASFGERIRYLRRENGGLPVARNTGARAARGEFLIFLDADDQLSPQVVESHIRVLASAPAPAPAPGLAPGIAVTIVNCVNIIMEGAIAKPWPPVQLEDDVYHQLLRENLVPPCCFCVRHLAFDSMGGFTEDRALFGFEDWDLWLRLAARGAGFRVAAGDVARYRVHAQSMSARRPQMFAGGTEVLLRNRGVHKGCATCRAVLYRNLSHAARAALLYGALPTARRAVRGLLGEAPLRVYTWRLALWACAGGRWARWLDPARHKH